MHVVVFPSGYPTQHAPVSGIFFQEQARALHELGLDMGVVYPDLRSPRDLSLRTLAENRFQVTEAVKDGIPTVRCHGWNVPGTTWRMRLYVVLFRRLMRRYVDAYGRPDLIHAHNVVWAGHAAQIVSEELDIPFVVTEHSSAFARGLYGPWQQSIIRDALHAASASIAVSQALADELVSFAPADRLHVIPNMVDTDRFRRPAAPRESRPFTFLTVALLRPSKRVDILLRAFAEAFAGHPDVRLEVAGDGPQRRKLDVMARRLGVADQIEVHGLLSRDEVRDRLWMANCFALASDVETFGVVLVEAMATGLPVIATRCGGPEEIVTHRNGSLVAPGDVSGLAEAMQEAYRTRDTIGEREEEIRRIVLERYAQPVVGDAIRSIYEGVCEGETTE